MLDSIGRANGKRFDRYSTCLLPEQSVFLETIDLVVPCDYYIVVFNTYQDLFRPHIPSQHVCRIKMCLPDRHQDGNRSVLKEPPALQ
jgi:hypothetical protein